jgi:hypothetical protein
MPVSSEPASGGKDKACSRAIRRQPHSMHAPTSRQAAGESFNRTTVLSKIHLHHYTCARRLTAPNGMRNTTERGARPRAQPPPRPNQALATCSPAGLVEGHSVDCGTRHQISRQGSVATSEGPPLRPSSALLSIFVTEGFPTSSKTVELTHPVRVFFP